MHTCFAFSGINKVPILVLALALANRSVALGKMGYHKSVVQDVEMISMNGTYPPENQWKLDQRLIQAHKQLNQFEEAKGALEKLRKSLGKSTLPKKKQLEIFGQAKKELVTLTTSENYGFLNLASESDKEGIRIKQTEKSPMKIEYSPDRGRYAVASRDIDVGELIMKDEAVCHIVDLNKSLDHCYSCLSHTLAPVPCQNCCAVVFCSMKCRAEAMEE